uniref:uncharacterized protein LOC101300244 n=1 Tax=Fragaria vesca subsp. vesca TaxID=101020 RepID=UPI0005C98F96|nr:PREDICTED: uncharacterized protein LOC101300244 [Fragaria vesca subsp. vesca]
MFYLYIVASQSAVSSILIRKESDVKHAIFYAGKGFTPAESRYPDVEKLALALIITTRKLKHYFQAHSITFYTNHPLRQIMLKPEISGRLVKWAIELGEFDIHYRPRVAIKGQAAADFISELTPMKVVGESSEPTPTKVVGVSNEANREENGPGADKEMHSEEPLAQLWKLFVDSSVTRNKSGTGIILETPDGFKHEYALEFQFKASNNAAEYEALIRGLQLARGIGVERVKIFSDSQLVVKQVNESFEANTTTICGYSDQILSDLIIIVTNNIVLVTSKHYWSLKHLECKEPQLHSYQTLSKAFMQRFKSASLSHIPRKENRHADALARLATGGLGKGRKKARIKVLGKPNISKTISEIFMIEAGPGEPTWMNPIIEFMKEGVRPEDRRQARKLQLRCARYTLMNGKLYRRGYNLPNLKCVTEEEGEVIMGEIHEGVCGNHSGSRSLAHKTLRIGFFWPNMGVMWGLDLIGILPTALGQFKFGIPETIVTDNGTQFNNNHLIEFTNDMGTKMVFSSVAHPQTNGQVEAVNKIIKKLLKKKLDDAKGLWAQKLPEVLWAIKTTTTEATGETPFSMAFGTEVVLPIETSIPSGRVKNFNATTNEEGLHLNIDLIEEKRKRADLHNQVYKQRVARHYNNKVRTRTLGLGDWVMKKIMTKPAALDPNWEGPYEIVEEVGPATLFLRDQDGIVTGRSWNTKHLRFYPV